MKERIIVQDQKGNVEKYIILPNKCPHCHKSIKPEIKSMSSVSLINETFGILLQCTSCYNYMFQAYNFNRGYSEASKINYSYTNSPLEIDIPKELDVFSKFKDIYIQALTAEIYGLDEITGISFRKSLEFLVKDYLIEVLNENAEEIAKLPLFAAINKIDSVRIKNLAIAASWIGNDQTHYERRYEDKEVSDMKFFIKALLHFIASELSAIEASKFIAENKKN